MPIQSYYDESLQLTCFIGDGDLTFDEIVGAVKDFYQNPEVRPTLNALADFRKATLKSLSYEQINQIPALIATYTASYQGGKNAIVTSTDVNFGLTRILEAVSAEHPFTIRAFRSYEAAMQWLDEKPLTADRAQAD
jgi:hypothetical protein